MRDQRQSANSLCWLAVLPIAATAVAFGFQSDPKRLVMGDAVTGELRGGQTQTFLVALRVGQFLDAVALQNGIDFTAVLTAPDGKAVGHGSCRNRFHRLSTSSAAFVARGS